MMNNGNGHKLTVSLQTRARIPTGVGEFHLCLYANSRDDEDHMALVMGDVAGRRNVLVRVHSECFTGDVLGSLRCDCGEQLALAMGMIAAEGSGVLIYLRQEGRGIGLLDKLRAYNLQDEGYDTVEANIALGHEPDERDYTVAAAILRDLDVRSIRLLTNNPAKITSLRALGVPIMARVPLEAPVHTQNADYLYTKASRMHHLLDLNRLADNLPPAGGASRP
jgi:GTP cyclohydrolase II